MCKEEEEEGQTEERKKMTPTFLLKVVPRVQFLMCILDSQFGLKHLNGVGMGDIKK